ncbi:hypothetical protein KDA23_00230 [Candidatus Saccharibacteria bacterium]|nr:hypothetical protein [Candidatus Saccharibacteria bacterium]
MADEGVKPAPDQVAQPPADDGKPEQAPKETPQKEGEAATASQGEMVDGKPVLYVKVYSPFKTFFDERAFSLSGVTLTGPFDILPKHHNFISLVEPCELVIQAPNGEKRIRISGGVMHVKADKATVLLDA